MATASMAGTKAGARDQGSGRQGQPMPTAQVVSDERVEQIAQGDVGFLLKNLLIRQHS